MHKLTRSDLWSLEQYSEQRAMFRIKIMEHKKSRQIPLGENARLYFEDDLTIRYQIQEMLRIEKVFDVAGIQDELDAYNPLIPDGSNWKATFMLEYANPSVREQKVRELIDIEHKVWVKVGDFDRVFPIADEDLERTSDEKTSTVHFLRFELTAGMVTAMKSGAELQMGIDHPRMQVAVIVESAVRLSLAGDLAPVKIN